MAANLNTPRMPLNFNRRAAIMFGVAPFFNDLLDGAKVRDETVVALGPPQARLPPDGVLRKRAARLG
jgi:hypothetical protein